MERKNKPVQIFLNYKNVTLKIKIWYLVLFLLLNDIFVILMERYH